MQDATLTEIFLRFGLAALLGFAIGLERALGEGEEAENRHTGVRDFVLFALTGALAAFIALETGYDFLLPAGFFGFLLLLLSGYWREYLRDRDADPGITTEAAAILAFLLGALVVQDLAGPTAATSVAIAVGILILAVLSQAGPIAAFRRHVRRFELDAALKLLVISFIVLPILPRVSLDRYIALPLGEVRAVEPARGLVVVATSPGAARRTGERLGVYVEGGGYVGEAEVAAAGPERLRLRLPQAALEHLRPGMKLRAEFALRPLSVMLSAIQPYKVWLIVILVSFVSFIGYVLVKVFGSRAGIGLTGLVGGLASSTATTLSFARRSLESPALNRHFAVAVLLASTVMFPRLLMQIAVVNPALMLRMGVPVLVMAGTGFALAGWCFVRERREAPESEALTLSNPFSLKAALQFALVFAVILMITRLAIAYLGDAWLPVVALVSGLTDADAIAFSVSDAQQAGLITLDWAAFNAVLGAIANTFMKLLLILSLGDRGLFKKLVVPVVVVGVAGLASAWLYYDLPWTLAPGAG